MRCPFCSQNIRLQGKFCPKCGKQIFGLPVQRPEDQQPGPAAPTPGRVAAPPPGPVMPPPPPPDLMPPAEYGDGMLDIELEPVGPPSRGIPGAPSAPAPTLGGPVGRITASADQIGKTCPYCRFPIKIGESIIVCDACKTPHHVDCWEENGGCTSYGCTRAPGARPQPVARAAGYPPAAGQPAAGYRRPTTRTAAAIGGMVEGIVLAEIERTANNALMYAILGLLCCPIIPSIAGFLMGLSVLQSIARLGVHAPGARGKAIAATVLGVLGPAMVIIGMLTSSGRSQFPMR